MDTGNTNTAGVAEISNWENFRAAHPEVKRVQDALGEQIKALVASFNERLKPMFEEVKDTANQAVAIGKLLNQFADTLPGKKITVDFYEQQRAFFTNGHGQTVEFRYLQWFMEQARKYPDGVKTVKDALEGRQMMLRATGDDQFMLEAESTRNGPVIQIEPDPVDQLLGSIMASKLDVIADKLRKDANYCRDGVMLAEKRQVLIIQLEPALKRHDAARAALRELLGV